MLFLESKTDNILAITTVHFYSKREFEHKTFSIFTVQHLQKNHSKLIFLNLQTYIQQQLMK